MTLKTFQSVSSGKGELGCREANAGRTEDELWQGAMDCQMREQTQFTL